MRLKATKTRLYALVLAHYPDIPPARQTEFVKAPRHRSWWLKFTMKDDFGAVFFSTCMGVALLSFTCGCTRDVIKIPLDELRKFDLVEE